jgi:MFS family permease
MENGWIESRVPARLDRLPWSRWHWLIVTALGATWILDGLEVTLAGAVGAILTHPETLGLTDAQVGGSATAYLTGAVLGALFFGYLTDRLGRKKLFFVTVGVYLAATGLTAFSWDFTSYAAFRFLTGAGIGGEYAAINSAIDELIPARLRGRIALFINGSYWFGAAMGAGATVGLLDSQLLPAWLAWRLVFGLGALLGLGVILLRRWVPESPRWLLIHGQAPAAEATVQLVEQAVERTSGPLPPAEGDPIRIRQRTHTPWREIWHAVAVEQPRRAVLGLSLMIAQAFFYNAIFFTYALVLMRFYGIPAERVGGYLLPFALGNVLGPLVLGHLFDVVGRKPMIVATYAISGLLLAVTGFLFHAGLLTATTQTIAWSVTFFFASAAASSAYLTVSEIFPLETRGMAIAIFYAVGTLTGGAAAPLLFGYLIGSGSPTNLLIGYLFGAVLMILAAGVEAWIGVKAEGRSLESICTPLAAREPPPAPLSVPPL